MSFQLPESKVIISRQVQELARKDLLYLLDKIEGTKAIVWDESLAGPVGLIATYSLLREHNVVKMFPLKAGQLPDTNIKNIVFITKPELHKMDFIADNVHSEERKGRKDYYLYFVPRKSLLCEKRLKSRGVYGNFVIEEFKCDIFPFDSDVLSMEIDSAFKLGLERDASALYQAARTLHTLQCLYGTIPRVSGKGHAAKQVWDLMCRLEREEPGKKERKSERPLIDHLLLLDRSVDLLTPLATQLTYEGLIDEIFGINNTTVQLPGERFSSTDSEMTGEKKQIILNSSEELYAEIRDKNFNAVGPALSRKAKLIAAQLEERHGEKTVQEMKQFVSKLPQILATKSSLATHTTIAELIKERTDNPDFLETLELEQELMNGIDCDKPSATIEDAIARKRPLLKVLRLMCMQSVTNSGLKPKLLEHYKREILQTYGYHHILSLSNLEQAGLLRSQQGPRQYAVLRKSLRLTVDDGSETEPTDVSYVHSIYAPLSVRLAQQLVAQQGWRGIQDVLPMLPGPTVEHTRPAGLTDDMAQNDSPKVILVFFLGGCTFAEISALRFLSQQEDSMAEFLVATTKLINGNTFLASLMEPLVADMDLN